MKISFAKSALPVEGALVVGILEGGVLPPTAAKLDELSGKTLTRAIAASRFEGKKDQTLLLLAPAGLEVSRLLLVGLGKADAFNDLAAEALGGAAVAQLAAAA